MNLKGRKNKMRDLYNLVEGILNKLDFDSLWKGFHLYPFALYDNKNVYLSDNRQIPYDNRFIANTTIEFEREHIAIWNVNDYAGDAEEVASELVHEMFHAYQMDNGEKRFPQDLEILNYPLNIESFEYKYVENVILAEAYQQKDIITKRELISRFICIRYKREDLIGKMIELEYLTETAEGMAEYVGCMALKKINIEKYKKRMQEYIRVLSEKDSMLFDIRRISYYSGAIFLSVLKDVEIDFYHALDKEVKPVFRLVSENFPKISNVEIKLDETIGRMANEYLKERDKQFQKFFEKEITKIETKGFIRGYDPMNMIKKENMILCTHFVMVQRVEEKEATFIQGPVVVELSENTINEVNCYYI